MSKVHLFTYLHLKTVNVFPPDLAVSSIHDIIVRLPFEKEVLKEIQLKGS